MNSVLESINPNGAVVKNANAYSEYIKETGWYSTKLTNLTGNTMYKLQMTAADTLVVESKAYDDNAGVSLVSGWNWIPYYRSFSLSLDDAFASGSYKVYLNDFKAKDFIININAQIDSTYNTSNNVKSKIESALMNVFNANVYRANITAEDVFNEINKLNLSGVKVLGVSFEVDATNLDYVTFNKTELPNLTNVGGI